MGRMKTKEAIKENLQIGVLFQKEPGGTFFYRYQVDNCRKQISLKTTDYQKAKELAEETYRPLVESKSLDIITAHVKMARSLSNLRKRLPLDQVWPTYDKHPDRATPATTNVYMEYEREWRAIMLLAPRAHPSPGRGVRSL